MRLIVDSGSTKTDWIAIDDNGSILFETFTLGLNPQVLTEYIIEERIINVLAKSLLRLKSGDWYGDALLFWFSFFSCFFLLLLESM